ncbi:MAG: type I secretion system permease/ATPase, partial [Campylobacterota bacterium]|nr:type I secretion system permease/ATPase [Campylobacterota bacterium]
MSNKKKYDGELDSLLDCLVVYTKAYHKPFSKEALIANLPIEPGKDTQELFSINHSKALFSRAAEHAGLKTKIIERNLDEISPLQLPLILILKDRQACVLDSFSKDRKQLKILTLFENDIVETWHNIEDINKEYLGFSIMLKKSFDTATSDHKTLDVESKHWFWSTLKLSTNIYKDVIFASILINIFVLAAPLFTMSVYDRVIPNNATETLWFFAIGVAIVYLIDTFLKFTRSYLIEIAAKKSDVIMSSILFEKVLDLKMAVRPTSVGAFASNLRDFDSIRSFLTNATIIALIDMPFTIIFLFVIYYIGGSMVMIPIVTILLILIYAFFVKSPLQESIKQTHEASAKKNSILIETLNNIETLKSMGIFGNKQWLWEEASGEIAKKSLHTRMLSSSIPTITGFLIQLNTVSIIIYGVYMIQEFNLTMGGLIASVILASRTVAPMGQAAALITNYNDAKESYSVLNNIVSMPVERPNNHEFVHRPYFKGKIEFQNVTFTYPGSEIPSLSNVSFTINPGERVAIVGRMGSGKSSIVKLILKLYEPDSGIVFVDGIDISQIDPVDLRKHIGYTSQQIALFSGTVKENITFKASYSTDTQMLNAAKISGVDDFVRKHPRGYDMTIGEGGIGLSGGQIQSIGIARAVLLEQPIMIFDEPTSSMDNQSEAIVVKNLKGYLADKTTLFITQKISLLSMVNRVIVIDNGKVHLDGTKEAVLANL